MAAAPPEDGVSGRQVRRLVPLFAGRVAWPSGHAAERGDTVSPMRLLRIGEALTRSDLVFEPEIVGFSASIKGTNVGSPRRTGRLQIVAAARV